MYQNSHFVKHQTLLPYSCQESATVPPVVLIGHQLSESKEIITSNIRSASKMAKKILDLNSAEAIYDSVFRTISLRIIHLSVCLSTSHSSSIKYLNWVILVSFCYRKLFPLNACVDDLWWNVNATLLLIRYCPRRLMRLWMSGQWVCYEIFFAVSMILLSAQYFVATQTNS